jgi:uncharacterized protein YlbG (UPF0298 family)
MVIKQSKAARIRVLLAEGQTVKQIAEKLKLAKPYVQQVRWHWKKDAKKTTKIAAKKAKLKPIKWYKPEPKEKKHTIAELLALSPFPEDKVDHPPHYTYGGIETIDYIEAKKLNYNLGNVIKYVSRADLKGKLVEDLKKARWYLDREIKEIEKLEQTPADEIAT